MLTLRPYQEEAIAAIELARSRGITRQIISLPTGSGKTCCFSHLVARESPQGRVIILCHRDELIDQTKKKILEFLPDAQIGVVKAGENAIDAPIVVASVQTLAHSKRREQLSRAWRIIIVDECHHALTDGDESNSWVKTLEWLGSRSGTLTVGFTATPFRPNGVSIVGDGNLFQDIVYYRHLLEMIEEGYLVMPQAIRLKLEGFSLDGVKQSAGDYSASDIESRMMSDAVKAPEQLAEAIQAHAASRRVIAFSPGAGMAHELTSACEKLGISAATILGNTPSDIRHNAYQSMRDGDTQVLSSVMVLTEGFDLPAVDCVLLARATRSKVLYQQAIGRGLRLSPETGKTNCLVLDATGATERNNLFSMAEMLGLHREKEKGEGNKIVERYAREQEDAENALALMIARHGELLRQSAYLWVKTIKGAFVLSLLDKILLRIKINPNDPNKAKLELKKEKKVQILAQNIPTPHAFGIGEDTARSMGHQRLFSKSASWLQQPGTEKQQAWARRLGIDPQQYPTRGALSDAITRITGDW